MTDATIQPAINQGNLENPNNYDDRNAWQAEYEEEPEIGRCPYCDRWMYEDDVTLFGTCTHQYPLLYLNKD